MQNSKLILVEGMPGTGKSTLSQIVARELTASGRITRWWHEESPSHPVRLYFDPARHQTWHEYFIEVITCWQNHVRQLVRNADIEILDVAILQNHVRSLLIFDCDRNRILDLVNRIEQVILAADPVLVYLKPRDVEANFRTIVSKRGPRLVELWIAAHDHYPFAKNRQLSSYAGFVAFWNEFDEISDRAFDQLSISKLRRTGDADDWDIRKADVLKQLNLSESQISSRTTPLDRFEGQYAAVGAGCLITEIRWNDDCLVATVEEPTFDERSGPIGRFRETRLIPVDETRFYVESWPYYVDFAVNSDEGVIEMHVSATEDGWDDCRWVFRCDEPGNLRRQNRSLVDR